MSTIQASNVSDGTTTVSTEYVVNGSAKTWARGTMVTTAAIYDSFNVSSISDYGVGYVGWNVTNAHTANYSITESHGVGSGNYLSANTFVSTSSNYRMLTQYPHTTTWYDCDYSVATHGDLA
jgi:hypothetical protein